MFYRIINKTKGKVIAEKARVANNFFSRLIGFMFRKNIDKDEAIIFYKAPSMHTFFMRVPIDIVFLDKNMKVIKTKTVRPYRIIFCKNSFVTIELKENKIIEIPIEKEDLIEFWLVWNFYII